MELSIRQLDEITECQHNLNDFELDEAIATLSDDQLVVLREQCQESVARQNRIIGLIQIRLAQS
jgi:hypothetical protein